MTHNYKISGLSNEANRLLTTTNKTWFVSYLYFKYICKKHNDWSKDNNLEQKLDAFKKMDSSDYPKYLKDIIKSNDKILGKGNQIDIDPARCKKMAHRILSPFLRLSWKFMNLLGCCK